MCEMTEMVHKRCKYNDLLLRQIEKTMQEYPLDTTKSIFEKKEIIITNQIEEKATFYHYTASVYDAQARTKNKEKDILPHYASSIIH